MDKNLHYIIADYIGINDDELKFKKHSYIISNYNEINTDEQQYNNLKFRVIEYYKRYDMDFKRLNGVIFLPVLKKICKREKDCKKSEEIFNFLKIIITDDLLVNHLKCQIFKYLNVDINTLYNETDFFNTHFLLYEKISDNWESIYLGEPAGIKHNNKAINNKLYNIYDNYALLKFQDINKYSPFVYNKYSDSYYLIFLFVCGIYNNIYKVHNRSSNCNNSFDKIKCYQFLNKQKTYNDNNLYKENYRYGYGNIIEEISEKYANFGDLDIGEMFNNCICDVKIKDVDDFIDMYNPFYKNIPHNNYMIYSKEKTLNNLYNELPKPLKHLFNNIKEWDNMIIAGGIIFNCMNAYLDQDKELIKDSDIDIFFYGNFTEQKKAFNKIIQIIKNHSDNDYHEAYKISKNVLELVGSERKIQLILTTANTLEEVFLTFDLDCLKVCYNGMHILGTFDFMWSVKFWNVRVDSNEYIKFDSNSMIKRTNRQNKILKKGMRIYSKYDFSKYLREHICEQTREYKDKLVVFHHMYGQTLIEYIEDILKNYNYTPKKKLFNINDNFCKINFARVLFYNEDDELKKYINESKESGYTLIKYFNKLYFMKNSCEFTSHYINTQKINYDRLYDDYNEMTDCMYKLLIRCTFIVYDKHIIIKEIFSDRKTIKLFDHFNNEFRFNYGIKIAIYDNMYIITSAQTWFNLNVQNRSICKGKILFEYCNSYPEFVYQNEATENVNIIYLKIFTEENFNMNENDVIIINNLVEDNQKERFNHKASYSSQPETKKLSKQELKSKKYLSLYETMSRPHRFP